LDGAEDAAGYNRRYKYKVGSKKSKYRKSSHPNDFDLFYARMSEDERRRWAESYMTFLDYYAIHRK